MDTPRLFGCGADDGQLPPSRIAWQPWRALDFPPDGYEVVVVNDGGGPDTDRVISSWEGRPSLSRASTEAEGRAAARNAGIETARGRFIAFTDDDSEPDSDWLRALQDALKANRGCAAGGRVVNGSSSRCAAGSQVVLEAAYAHFNRDPGGARFYATINLAFPAEELRRLGGFDEGVRHAEVDGGVEARATEE